MATIGQSLTAPEAGWKRYDDTDPNITYLGGYSHLTESTCYNGTYTQGTTMSAQFNFTGTKFRLISLISIIVAGGNYTTSGCVTIDGKKIPFTEINSNVVWQALVCDVQGLSDGEHSAVISCDNNGQKLLIDAIDIDVSGILKPYNPISAPVIPAPTSLTATAGDSQVTLSWTAVAGATGYNVKRATTAGGPYTTVGSNVSGTSYVDSSVTNGTTYYYVVTALNGTTESANSNEASATPVAASKSLLRVTVLDSSERDYQLTTAEIDSFVAWFNSYTSTSTHSYMLTKKVGTQNSKEYLAFDKIISFEVIALS